MASNFTYGPLSGPAPPRNRRRNPFWRFRRFFFVIAVVAGAALAVVWNFASQVELTDDDFDTLIATSYVCTAEVSADCNADNATYELSAEGEDRVFVAYEDIPEVMVQAVIATEDKNYFDHSGVDPVGLARAGYQGVKNKVFGGSGSIQGGSTITQQYIKLSSGDDARGLDSAAFARKGREIVRAIKSEQQLTEKYQAELDAEYGDTIPEGLDAKLMAKQDILERYLNRVWFGRRSYGVQAAARNYFDKDVEDLTLPESAYLAGLIRNPTAGEYTEHPDEAARRREVTLGLMADNGYITPEQRDAAVADDWASVTPGVESRVLGDVKGHEYGTDYFIDAVRRDLEDIYPEGEYFTKGIRVYTTLDPRLQQAAYETVTGRLDPTNEFMPLGALVSLDEQGRVVALMGGADWNGTANNPGGQVNLATGDGGLGFQPGSTMKPIVLAEFLKQGFSLLSNYDRGPITLSGEKYAGYENTWPNHRTVLQATTYSSNIVYLKMGQTVGIPQVIDMAQRLGITKSPLTPVDSLPLGPENVTPLEMATVYSTFANEGRRLDPVMIDRIEDADGNVLCWYPTADTDCSGNNPTGNATRTGEEVIDGSVARQVNYALRTVVTDGTGKRARLTSDDAPERMAVGKTGTTDNYRDAWFSGFTCNLTTSVWMGYPNPHNPVRDGVEMTDEEYDAYKATLENWELDKQENGTYWLMSNVAEPRSADLFGENYPKIEGGTIPAEMWHDYMLAATANDEPCDSLPMEEPDPNAVKLGQELETTLVPCAEPDPSLVAQPPAESTTQNGGGDNGGGDNGGGGDAGGGGAGDETALGWFGSPGHFSAAGARSPLAMLGLGGRVGFQDGEGNPGGGGNGGEFVTPTTTPCIPIDADGNTIPTEPGDGSSTTLDPAAPTTVDPNSTDTTDTTDPEQTASTGTTEPPSTSETTAATTETTQPPDTSETTAATNPGNGNGNGNNGNGKGNGGG